jgi:hypothetical protein
MDIEEIYRKCKFCSSNQTTVSSNQQYMYCLNCQKKNLFRCPCGSFDFEMEHEYTAKCNNCTGRSWVPEFFYNETAIEFLRLSKKESDKRLQKNKPKIEFNMMNMCIIGILIFCYMIK